MKEGDTGDCGLSHAAGGPGLRSGPDILGICLGLVKVNALSLCLIKYLGNILLGAKATVVSKTQPSPS